MNKYGCKKEIKDNRDYKFKIDKKVKVTLLPNTYKIQMPKVKNQGSINSCVAHSLSTYMEELYRQVAKQFSVGFIYGYRPLGYSQEEGMYPREAVKTLQKVGSVEYKDFPYNKEIPEIKNMVDEQLETLKQKAETYKIKSYARISKTKDIKQCLANDVPVPISIPVYNNLALDKNNIVKMPEGECEGYHMIILYGYNEKGWLLQNSWGTNWGYYGRAILPYNYPIDTAWAIDTEINNIQTYQTILQKLLELINKIIKTITKK